MAEAPAMIQLRGYIEGGTPPFTYTMQFGDGQTEEGTTDTGKIVIDHNYVGSGTYTASLLVKDVDGRTGTSATVRGVSDLTMKKDDALEKSTSRRSWRFWRRRREEPEKREEEIEVVSVEEEALIKEVKLEKDQRYVGGMIPIRLTPEFYKLSLRLQDSTSKKLAIYTETFHVKYKLGMTAK